MKTVYIPAGATYNYETLVTDDVIVHGHLHVTNGQSSAGDCWRSASASMRR